MTNLLQDLEGKLEQSSNIETSITNHLKYYFNFKRDTSYEKRLHQELMLFFKEKKGNKNYFHIEEGHTKIKPSNFNSILHFFLKRLWDEENFNSIMKLPSTMIFIAENTAHINNAKVSLEDIQKQTSPFKLFPFIPPEKNFFSMPMSEQVKVCSDWVKNGNKQNALLERFKIIGSFVQTMYLLGQLLLKLAEDLEANKNVTTTEEISGNALEERAGILAQVIINHPLTVGGYLKFSETPLKRSLMLNSGAYLTKEGINIKFIYSLLTPTRNSGVTDKELAVAAGKILEDFKSLAFSEKKEEPKTENNLNLKDLSRVIDFILMEVRAIIRSGEEPAKMRISVRAISESAITVCPGITERHITLVYLYLKDIYHHGKNSNPKDILDTYMAISDKFKLNAIDSKYIYYLIDSETLDSMKEPLSHFIEKYSKEEKKELSDKQVETLKSIMGNFPKEVTLNQLFSIKEKLKLKVEDEPKKKMIEIISTPLLNRITDMRFLHAEAKLKEK